MVLLSPCKLGASVCVGGEDDFTQVTKQEVSFGVLFA